MKYQFKSNINEKEYDKFVRNFPSTTFMQTSSWANVKNNWEKDFVGMFNGEKLVCAAMVLKRKLFLNKKLFYIPRGFVVDYNDSSLVSKFIKELKKYAKENNAIDIKIDPFICFNEENIQTIKKKKEIDIKRPFVAETDKIIKLLEETGFKH